MFEKAEILIVDDMPEHIAFAGTILRNEGFRVLGATSAKAALKMMEKSKPHLVLLDIMCTIYKILYMAFIIISWSVLVLIKSNGLYIILRNIARDFLFIIFIFQI